MLRKGLFGPSRCSKRHLHRVGCQLVSTVYSESEVTQGRVLGPLRRSPQVKGKPFSSRVGRLRVAAWAMAVGNLLLDDREQPYNSKAEAWWRVPPRHDTTVTQRALCLLTYRAQHLLSIDDVIPSVLPEPRMHKNMSADLYFKLCR